MEKSKLASADGGEPRGEEGRGGRRGKKEEEMERREKERRREKGRREGVMDDRQAVEGAKHCSGPCLESLNR